MKYSIRTGLIGFTIVAVIVGVFFSRSNILLSMATILMTASSLLALALAIVARRGKREFCIGFSVLSLGTLLLASSFSTTYDSLAVSAISPVLRSQANPVVPPVANFSVPRPVPVPSATPAVPQAIYNPIPLPAPTYVVPAAGVLPAPTFRSADISLLKDYFAASLSMLFGLIGGLAATWATKSNAAPGANYDDSANTNQAEGTKKKASSRTLVAESESPEQCALHSPLTH